MPGPNGLSAVLRIRSDTTTYPVEDADGETTLLAGYHKGASCPISVEIEVEEAWAEWSEDTPSDDERPSLTPHRFLAKTMRAERLLRRNLLCAAIPGLERGAADVAASDGGPWERILVELGWWQATGEAAPEGEAAAGDSDGSTGSPASPDSSEPTTASRSRTAKR
jgi:hypothetical protein